MEGRLYIVGETQFESLVSLITYYTRNPLYRNVKLTYPISTEMLRTMSKRYGNDAVVRRMGYFLSLDFQFICRIDCRHRMPTTVRTITMKRRVTWMCRRPKNGSPSKRCTIMRHKIRMNCRSASMRSSPMSRRKKVILGGPETMAARNNIIFPPIMSLKLKRLVMDAATIAPEENVQLVAQVGCLSCITITRNP